MSRDLTEKTLTSQSVFEGKLLKVRRDTVGLVDGSEAVREWIDHPGAAAVVPLLSDGRVVLVKQYRYALGRTVLEVPAGKLDQGDEVPLQVAERELAEETGYRAGSIELLASLAPCVGYGNEVIHFYIARDLEAGSQALDVDEHVEVIRMPFAEAVARAERGEFVDMKTTVALLLARDRVRPAR